MRQKFLIALMLLIAVMAAPMSAQTRYPRVLTLPAAMAGTPTVYYANAVAAGATGTETAITLTKSAGTAATSTAASQSLTSGRRFHIQMMVFVSRGNTTATEQVTTFSVRINTGGAVTTATTPAVFQWRSTTPASTSAVDRFVLPFTDGYEIIGTSTLQWGVTANSVYVTNAPTWDVMIVGYVY